MKSKWTWLVAILIVLASVFMVGQSSNWYFVPDVIVTDPDGSWIDTRVYTTFDAAVAAAGVNTRDIRVYTTETVSASLNIPVTCSVYFRGDGQLTGGAGVIIDFLTRNIDAPDRIIFTGIADYDFANGSVIRSRWFTDLNKAFADTTDDEITLVISHQGTISANRTVGNAVHLKWEAPGNQIVINAGINLGNIGQIDAENYILFSGSGDFDFAEGTKLKSSWFRYLRSATTYIGADVVTLQITDDHTMGAGITAPATLSVEAIDSNIITLGAFNLALNGHLNAKPKQLFNENGAGVVTFSATTVQEVYPELWGENTTPGTTDMYQEIYRAMVVADGEFPIQFQNGIYACSAGLLVPNNYTELRGMNNGYSYAGGNTTTTLMFTGGTYGIRHTHAFVTMLNITINGNSTIDYGFDGGYFSFLENVTVHGCNVAGIRTGGNGQAAQGSRIVNSSFSNNVGDGALLQGGTTMTWDKVSFRDNGAYGVNGELASDSVWNNVCLFEGNIDEAMNLTGTPNRVKFIGTYFEIGGDPDVESYHILANITGPSRGIVFDNAFFGAQYRGIIDLTAGYVEFNNCDISPTTDNARDIISITAGVSNAYLNNSFLDYSVPVGVKIAPNVTVDKNAKMVIPHGSSIDISAENIVFTTNDFAVSFVVAPDSTAATSEVLLGGKTAGLTLLVQGNTNGVWTLVVQKEGTGSPGNQALAMHLEEPSNIVYTRISNVGYVYVNGNLAGSFADANDYTGEEHYISSDTTQATWGNWHLYQFSVFNGGGLTAAQVMSLWKSYGNISLAELTTNAVTDFNFTIRPFDQVYDNIKEHYLDLDGAALWVSPTILEETVTTVAPALAEDGSTNINSNANAVAGTLADGDYPGQTKTIVMIEASNPSTVTVASHVTSSPEVFTFNAINDTLVLMWTGTVWVTIFNNSVAT